MTRPGKIWLIGAAGLLAYSMVAWVTGTLLHLRGADLWLLRGGLLLLGLIAAVVVFWFVARPTAAPAATSAADGDELDAIVADARAHLGTSRLGRKTSLGHLPIVLLLGPPGSTKTTIMLHSGLDPELLAGEGLRDRGVGPTKSVNLWYAEDVVFLEAGGQLAAEPARWARLIHHLHPRRLGPALSGGASAPRVAVVCFGCDEFLRPGNAEAVPAAARELRARVAEVSQQLGIRLPVYVVFTKADQIPFFTDYVHNLSREEAREVLGKTLPLGEELGAGSFSDRATERLSGAIERLFRSLAERRIELLSREHVPGRVAAAYEFPREFRKVAPLAVQFLVELCKPSQLRVSPFLRGFYFTGVRPVVVEDVAPAAVSQVARPAGSIALGATRVFDADSYQKAAAVPDAAVVPGSRRVPQWLFLDRIFRDVILRDQAARGVAQGGTRVDLLRRLLLASAAALSLVLAAGFVISYVGNRRLEASVLRAADRATAVALNPDGTPSVESLRRLDTLRAELESLRRHERDGAPWRLRWGLYTGTALHPAARLIYFKRFSTLMFGSTYTSLRSSLRTLPSAPREADGYGNTYRQLKAYLITTTHPDSSTAEFLSPVLMRQWTRGGPREPERAELARRQFDFYAEELRVDNPYHLPVEASAVARARAFLLQFTGAERIYQSMTSDASRRNSSVRFDREVPTATAYVRESYEVPGAFTRRGWGSMEGALKNADRFFEGEAWVLGTDAGVPADRAKVLGELRSRYLADYARHWRSYLDSGAVVRYASVRDAARSLAVLGGNQSPLLKMLVLATRNTTVPDTAVAKMFQPLRVAMPVDSAGKLIVPANKEYVTALAELAVALERVANAPMGEGELVASQAVENADGAKSAARKIAQGFEGDGKETVGGAVQRLLEEPIAYTDPLLRNFGAAELNAAGGAFCSRFRKVMAKYPFNPLASASATPEEVAAMFQPAGGALQTLYDEALQKVLVRRGSGFVATPDRSITVSPAFVRFFNRAWAVSEALFREGGTEPRLSFSLTPVLSEGINSVAVSLEGQTVRFNRQPAETKPFLGVNAAGHSATLSAELGGSDWTWKEYQKPWAIFRLFHGADRWRQSGDVYTVEWTLRSGGRPITAGGTPATVAFQLTTGGGPPVLRSGSFDGLACPGAIVR